MSNKKINDENLEKVSGGMCGGDPSYLPFDYGYQLDRVDVGNHIGSNVYIVDSRACQNFKYYWGPIVKVDNIPASYVTITIKGMSPKASEYPEANTGNDHDFNLVAFKVYLKKS